MRRQRAELSRARSGGRQRLARDLFHHPRPRPRQCRDPPPPGSTRVAASTVRAQPCEIRKPTTSRSRPHPSSSPSLSAASGSAAASIDSTLAYLNHCVTGNKRHPSPDIFEAAIKSVGNIVTGIGDEVEEMIDDGLVQSLRRIFDNGPRERMSEACWVVANLAARIPSDRVNYAGDLKTFPLLDLIREADNETKKEAILALSNIIARDFEDDVKYFVGEGCVQLLLHHRDCEDGIVGRRCAEAIEAISAKVDL